MNKASKSFIITGKCERYSRGLKPLAQKCRALVGGSWTNGATAGVFALNVNNGVGNANVNIGARLCFLCLWAFAPQPRSCPASWQNIIFQNKLLVGFLQCVCFWTLFGEFKKSSNHARFSALISLFLAQPQKSPQNPAAFVNFGVFGTLCRRLHSRKHK
mgnify:CR=1 FL=1